MARRHLSIVAAASLAFFSGCAARNNPPAAAAAARAKVPTVEEAVRARTDVWGDAALARPGGPSYAFFRDLLPPLRYPTASFRDYPIVLSAPRAPVKVRLVSNGSTINALGHTSNWAGETGIPATFHVGSTMEVFGTDLGRLDGPRYDRGYLPITELAYHQGPATVTQECFALVDPKLADHGVAFVRVGIPADARVAGKQKVEVWFQGDFTSDVKTGQTEPIYHAGSVFDAGGKVIAAFDGKWAYTRARSVLTTFLAPGEVAHLAICTTPVDKGVLPTLTPAVYGDQRRACAERWDQILAGGMRVRVPEEVVNDAWRATLIANYELVNGDRMHYSAGNQYAGLYVGEGGDATRAFALWGHEEVARRVMPVLFNFTRSGLEYHQAAFKLQMLAHYYRLTRDADYLRRMRPLWERELNVLLNGREASTGMAPPEKYAGDLAERVPSLNSNANAWRALRDMAGALADLAGRPATGPVATFPPGRITSSKYPAPTTADAAARLRTYPTAFSGKSERELASLCASTAAGYRKVILAALDRAVDRSTTPPFIPVDLSGHEKPYDPITATSPGSYWNIMVQYALGSGVFAYNSQYADDLLGYLRTRGGVCMGLSRSSLNRTQWVQNGTTGINDLYGLRTAVVQLERDEVDRALVTFYGKLAQGFTRDTFVGCEGSSIVPLDRYGRQMALPPNSASNAYFLWQLRYMLVQDFDLDDDGRDETLRLLFATPAVWLADGQGIEVEGAPTSFGTVGLNVRSHVKGGYVTADLDLPPAPRTLLRLRLPDGYRVTGATVGGRVLKPDGSGALDLTGLRGKVAVRAAVAR